MNWAYRLLCVVVLACALTGPAQAAPKTMTVASIMVLAKAVVGYSYWWGHGRYRMDNKDHGSCKGNCSSCGCPSCTHSGGYGADCSGFVGKAWQVPGPIPVTTDAHPYSTWSFMGSSSNWTPVAKGSAKMADAFVYNNGSAGHIFLYEKGDPYGSVWAYECKGCSYGCVHDLRSTSGYSGRRRVNITSVADSDSDGVPDSTDNCDKVKNADQKDANKDGQGDACDTDDDGDGVADAKDNCDLVKNADQKNVDKDALGDACDPDNDNDGVVDGKDNCPNNSNKNQADLDKDKVGDVCDPDTDGDGVANAKDNCPLVKNADQKDTDKDGKGNACETDGDKDGVPDKSDNCPALKNADQADQDGDGKGDLCDTDADGDGALDSKDNCLDEKNADQKDTDKDGKGDVCDDDLDGDGVADKGGSGPFDNCPGLANLDQDDADGDGQGDDCDADSDGDGVSNGADNCPTLANPDQMDMDKNGMGDACEGDPGEPDAGPIVDAGEDDAGEEDAGAGEEVLTEEDVGEPEADVGKLGEEVAGATDAGGGPVDPDVVETAGEVRDGQDVPEDMTTSPKSDAVGKADAAVGGDGVKLDAEFDSGMAFAATNTGKAVSGCSAGTRGPPQAWALLLLVAGALAALQRRRKPRQA